MKTATISKAHLRTARAVIEVGLKVFIDAGDDRKKDLKEAAEMLTKVSASPDQPGHLDASLPLDDVRTICDALDYAALLLMRGRAMSSLMTSGEAINAVRRAAGGTT